jgi:uncharacterized membrane protein
MMKRIFWNGMKVLLPLVITVAIIYWVVVAIEHFFGNIILLILGPHYYFPGLGFLVGIVLVFIVGILMNAWLGQRLHQWWLGLIKKIPIVNWLHKSFSDLMGFFEQRKKAPPARHVVMVSFGAFRALGFVTREDFTGLIEGLGREEEVSVFIPLAYQIGGAFINVPRGAISPIDMAVEHAMRYAITAGMATRP